MNQPSDDRAVPVDFVSFLPERVWYLTASGQDMWCRRPYTFFFTSSEAAVQFAIEMKTAFQLSPIGVDRRDLISEEGLVALHRMEVTKIFVDPRIDPGSGDVFGTILRLDPR